MGCRSKRQQPNDSKIAIKNDYYNFCKEITKFVILVLQSFFCNRFNDQLLSFTFINLSMHKKHISFGFYCQGKNVCRLNIAVLCTY